MITCVVEYTIDAAEVDAFERFGQAWIALVNRRARILSAAMKRPVLDGQLPE